MIPNAALFLTSGRGIAATPTGGPQSDHLLGIPRGAINEEEGRAAVQELHSHGVQIVKVWVDSRGGAVPQLEPDVYRAIIDEAHSYGMQVVAHVGRTSALADAKDLLRAGIDGFAHSVRDRDVDDEYLALVRQYPEVWTLPNLPGNLLTMDDMSWLSETLPAFEIERLREEIENRQAAGPDDPGALFFSLQCRNLVKKHEAGMAIGLGTDSGAVSVAFNVAWTAHTEMRDMVTCGLSPDGGDHGSNECERQDPRTRRSRDRDRRKERVIRGARREPPGRHQQHQAYFSRSISGARKSIATP